MEKVKKNSVNSKNYPNLEKGLYINIWIILLIILIFITIISFYKEYSFSVFVALIIILLILVAKICKDMFFGAPVVLYKKIQGLSIVLLDKKQYMSMIVYSQLDGKKLYDSEKEPDPAKSAYYLAELEKNKMNINYNFKYKIYMISYKKALDNKNLFITAQWHTIVTKR